MARPPLFGVALAGAGADAADRAALARGQRRGPRRGARGSCLSGDGGLVRSGPRRRARRPRDRAGRPRRAGYSSRSTMLVVGMASEEPYHEARSRARGTPSIACVTARGCLASRRWRSVPRFGRSSAPGPASSDRCPRGAPRRKWAIPDVHGYVHRASGIAHAPSPDVRCGDRSASGGSVPAVLRSLGCRLHSAILAAFVGMGRLPGHGKSRSFTHEKAVRTVNGGLGLLGGPKGGGPRAGESGGGSSGSPRCVGIVRPSRCRGRCPWHTPRRSWEWFAQEVTDAGFSIHQKSSGIKQSRRGSPCRRRR